MKTRHVSANRIFTLSGKAIDCGQITFNQETGEIIEIDPRPISDHEKQNVEFYNGIIVPGFVNAHTHLELSNMKDVLTPGSHLIDFLLGIDKMRCKPANAEECIKIADLYMWRHGISAVCDICNTALTAQTKSQSKIKYKNCIELIGTTLQRIEKDKIQYETVKSEFLKNGIKEIDIRAVAHAPYSVSPQLFEVINLLNTNKSLYTIHNQESESENEMYRYGKGDIKESFPLAGIDTEPIPVTGKSSLQSCADYFREYQNVILVHNTFTSVEDALFATQLIKNIYWCLCPKSNLLLEHTLPSDNLLRCKDLKFVIGTDSLSSNNKLDILDEMLTIQNNYSFVNFDFLIEAACKNGAEALNLQDSLGTIEKGKTPGLVYIDNFDLINNKITSNSNATRII